MKSKTIHYVIPIFLFSIIWSAEEFFISTRYTEAGISVQTIGLLFAFSSIISLVLDIPAGKLSDRIGREKLITYSMLLVALAMLLLFLSSSFIWFVVSTGLIGLAYGLNWSPLMAYVGDMAKKNNRGSTFADFFTLTAIGEALAPILTVVMVMMTNNRFPFLIFAIVAVLCCLMYANMKPEGRSSIPKTHPTRGLSYKSSWKILRRLGPHSIFLLLMGFFVSFFWESVWFSQPLVGVYENSLMDAALIVAAFALPTIIFSKPLGKLIDHIGEHRVFFYSLIFVILCFVIFYLSPNLPLKLISIFLASTGVVGVWLVLDVLSVKVNKKEERGEFFGILETVRDSSYAIAPLFIGFSYKFIGLNGVFLVNSAIASLLLIFGIWIFGRKHVY